VKTIVILTIIALCAVSSGKTRVNPGPTASPTPTGIVEKSGMVCRTKQQDLELRDWINGILNQAHKAEAENAAAKKSEDDVKARLEASVVDATNLANECAKDRACAQAPLSCWFHRLMQHIFWILGGLVVLAIGLSIASIFFPALGPILDFFVSIWKWILGLFTSKPKV
jgi:hypothetical protein